MSHYTPLRKSIVYAAVVAWAATGCALLHPGIGREKGPGSTGDAGSKAVSSTDEVGTPSIPDFSAISSTEARVQTFFAFMRPLVESENDRVRDARQRLARAFEAFRGGRVSAAQKGFLKRLARRYEVSFPEPLNEDFFTSLLSRVDIVPAELALVQAAIESGWGRSRFAREGQNYFGLVTSDPDAGIVPSERDTSTRHRVAEFDSPRASVRSYIWNLNTHHAYQAFRQRRAEIRATGEGSIFVLTGALTAYSEQEKEYVRLVNRMLRQHFPDVKDPVVQAPSYGSNLVFAESCRARVETFLFEKRRAPLDPFLSTPLGAGSQLRACSRSG